MRVNVGQRIKEEREKRGLTTTDLAVAIGVNRVTIYRYEKNEIEKMPLHVLQAIAEALHVSPAYLMGLTEDKRPIVELTEESKEIARAYQEADPLTKRLVAYALHMNEIGDRLGGEADAENKI